MILQSAVFHDFFMVSRRNCALRAASRVSEGLERAAMSGWVAVSVSKKREKIFSPLHKNTVNPSGILQDGKILRR